MRKLLSVIAVFSLAITVGIGPAVAQNNTGTIEQYTENSDVTADINQDGRSNAALIRQGQINPPRNRAGVKKSSATVKQVGFSGDAAIYQGTSGGFSAKSDAFINQKGNSKARIWQGVGNTIAEANNLAQQDQDGNGHVAKIKQGVNSNNAAAGKKNRSNVAKQFQRNGSGNYAEINQGVGNGGLAKDNKARQLQNGSFHKSFIDQGLGVSTSNSFALTKQFGTGQTATIIQEGAGNSEARIQQSN